MFCVAGITTCTPIFFDDFRIVLLCYVICMFFSYRKDKLSKLMFNPNTKWRPSMEEHSCKVDLEIWSFWPDSGPNYTFSFITLLCFYFRRAWNCFRKNAMVFHLHPFTPSQHFTVVPCCTNTLGKCWAIYLIWLSCGDPLAGRQIRSRTEKTWRGVLLQMIVSHRNPDPV